MAGKSGAAKGSAGSRVVTALVGAGAAFGARKLLFFGWKKITGKEPPEHPEDPQVGLGEALIWGVVLGAGVHTARCSRPGPRPGGRSGESGSDGGPPV